MYVRGRGNGVLGVWVRGRGPRGVYVWEGGENDVCVSCQLGAAHTVVPGWVGGCQQMVLSRLPFIVSLSSLYTDESAIASKASRHRRKIRYNSDEMWETNISSLVTY